MIIEKVKIEGFRNFSNLTANLKKSTLIIGANDVGKTNLMYALRLLLDKSLSERDIEPEVTDFHISKDGNRAEIFSITIFFKDINEDAPSHTDSDYYKASRFLKTCKFKLIIKSITSSFKFLLKT
jgi:putative ATP-dependent endonuclease of OLD family